MTENQHPPPPGFPPLQPQNLGYPTASVSQQIQHGQVTSQVPSLSQNPPSLVFPPAQRPYIDSGFDSPEMFRNLQQSVLRSPWTPTNISACASVAPAQQIEPGIDQSVINRLGSTPPWQVRYHSAPYKQPMFVSQQTPHAGNLPLNCPSANSTVLNNVNNMQPLQFQCNESHSAAPRDTCIVNFDHDFNEMCSMSNRRPFPATRAATPAQWEQDYSIPRPQHTVYSHVPAPVELSPEFPAYTDAVAAPTFRVADQQANSIPPSRVNFVLPTEQSVRHSVSPAPAQCISAAQQQCSPCRNALTPMNSRLPKLPPFTPEKATTWFAIVDEIFNHYGLDEATRFLCLISHLHDKDDLISDLVGTPATPMRYTLAKKTILQRLAHTTDAAIRRVLHVEQLGTRTPSQLWRRLRTIVDEETIPDRALLTIWTDKLPPDIRLALSLHSPETAERRVAAADNVHNAWLLYHGRKPPSDDPAAGRSHPRNTSATPAVPGFNKQKEVRFAALPPSQPASSQNADSPADSGPYPPSQATNPPQEEQPQYPYCYYHTRFGEAAKKCKKPCYFPNAGSR